MTLNTQHRNRLNVESDLRCTLSPTPPRIDNLECFTVETSLA
ncbi:hypothetical protein T09_14345 [Trichinella sp. T9]|nr:hypothetical protein T09_14345 [Trichinella sp. T9]